ncbi:ras gtpase-related [Anaeramoeba flamelloides]|uniref:small monomeric GTPase n=1 Tax=Anaeramoeba flamelloides TaxID=1746091 RepID=A0AAV7YD57_9EUKA|nr:ras gtpase-related [Anaeramoeba flamelloides]
MEHIHKVVVLGSGGVGKSALIIQFLQNYFLMTYDPTIEESYRKEIQVDNNPCFLEILDTAGSEYFSAMRDQFINSGEGFLIMYSVNSRESFEQLPEVLKQIKKAKDKNNRAVVIIGNKIDLKRKRKISVQEGKDFSNSHGAAFFETSAKDRINVDESFNRLVQEIRKTKSIKKRTKRCSIL